MAWLAVNKDGQEMIFPNKPHFDSYSGVYRYTKNCIDCGFYYVIGTELPQGTIERLIGEKITHYSSPIEFNEVKHIDSKKIKKR